MTTRSRTERTETAGLLLDDFLEETGVVGSAPPRRYLWTDAFAVCTLLGLHEEDQQEDRDPGSGEDGGGRMEQALRLVEQVHDTLGRHREDDTREGWISGLDEEEGERHPTAGGLRIGKPLPERSPDEPLDRRLEWERDGQYYHYLTRWMHALARTAHATGDPAHLRHAVELAQAAHDGFVRTTPEGGARMAWKMSIDLSRPLVDGTGQHDPLDGYVTYRSLTSPGTTAGGDDRHGLQEETAQLARLARLDDPSGWVTDDPLGLGGLLVNAWRVARLRSQGVAEAESLLLGLLDAAEQGFARLRRGTLLDQPPARRLPFRELGLSLGVRAVERLAARVDAGDLPGAAVRVEERLGHILEAQGMARSIEATWTDPAARELDCWTDHADINAVMLAASLAPDGYLGR